MTKILLVTPPFTQLNTPYPATTYLCGFLRTRGYDAHQADLSLETLLRIFSRPGLTRMFAEIGRLPTPQPEPVRSMLDQQDRYLDTIDAVVRFLQGRDQTLAHRLCHGHLLPEGPRFAAQEEDSAWAFGTLGLTDRARHRCTLYLDDLTDLLRATIAPHFGLSRYAERLAAAATSFDPLQEALEAPPTLIDQLLCEALELQLQRHTPDLVGFTAPFPGNLYGALRAARHIRQHAPHIRCVLGGGYPNTELRSLQDPRIFDQLDFITLDDGERPLICLLEHLEGKRSLEALRRTFVRIEAQVRFMDGATEHDLPFSGVGAPTYDGLPIDRYLSVLEVLNPMHRLWSDGRWNKLTLAHGCYWKKCAFCDVTLDYIGRYDPAPAALLVDRIDSLLAETTQSGFHFVDEAAPPLLLRDLALELLARGRIISWWGNIRFEKTFTPDLCRLLAASGCIAVSGGFEVASDRVLKRMNKGVTVDQVAQVANSFTQAGVMVHAYLMYGFPTQTAQETLDSLERVRQLIEAGALQSGFWHRFVATRHAPIGQAPEAFDIELIAPEADCFASNDLEHRDPLGCDHDTFTLGLDRAIQSYMTGAGLDEALQTWFDHPVPAPTVDPRWAAQAIEQSTEPEGDALRRKRVVWLGDEVERVERPGRRGQPRTLLKVRSAEGDTSLEAGPVEASWLEELLNAARPRGRGARPYETLELALQRFPGDDAQQRRLLDGKTWRTLRALGLVMV